MNISQVLINSLLAGSQLSMLALGLTMTYSILGFANFAHGELSMVGAYVAYFFCVSLKLDLFTSAIIAILFSGALAIGCDRLVFKKMRKTPVLALIIASLGLSLSLRYIISAIWGPDPLAYNQVLARPYRFMGAYITSTQITVLGVTVTAMFCFHFLLHKTKLGKSMRALSDDMSLAQDRGINVERTISWVWFICGCFAGLGGVLMAWETALWPELGFNIIIPVFCAAILGGIGNVYGAVIGALLIGFVENVGLAIDWSKILALLGLSAADSPLYIPTEYKPAISFTVLVIVLIFLPSGLLGSRKVH